LVSVIRVENIKNNKSWKYYISFLVDVSLLENETAKISSQRKFQSIRDAENCSRKPQKYTGSDFVSEDKKTWRNWHHSSPLKHEVSQEN